MNGHTLSLMTFGRILRWTRDYASIYLVRDSFVKCSAECTSLVTSAALHRQGMEWNGMFAFKPEDRRQ
jgi:hypothetical protein